MFIYLILTLLFNEIFGIKKPDLIDETSRWSRCPPVNQTIYDFNVETLNGGIENLSAFKGQVLLIVNVATFCGII